MANRMAFCLGSVARPDGPTDRLLFACCQTKFLFRDLLVCLVQRRSLPAPPRWRLVRVERMPPPHPGGSGRDDRRRRHRAGRCGHRSQHRQKYRHAERESLPFTPRSGAPPRTGVSPVLDEFGVAEVPVSRVYCPNLDLPTGSVSKITSSRSEIQKDIQVHFD